MPKEPVPGTLMLYAVDGSVSLTLERQVDNVWDYFGMPLEIPVGDGFSLSLHMSTLRPKVAGGAMCVSGSTLDLEKVRTAAGLNIYLPTLKAMLCAKGWSTPAVH